MYIYFLTICKCNNKATIWKEQEDLKYEKLDKSKILIRTLNLLEQRFDALFLKPHENFL